MTFGYSRDDAEGGFLLKYVEDGILPVNPFQTLDDAVVGLMKIAVDKGRATRPGPRARHLRRARRRPGVDLQVRDARPRLRLVLAVPRPGRAPRRRPGRARQRRPNATSSGERIARARFGELARIRCGRRATTYRVISAREGAHACDSRSADWSPHASRRASAAALAGHRGHRPAGRPDRGLAALSIRRPAAARVRLPRPSTSAATVGLRRLPVGQRPASVALLPLRRAATAGERSRSSIRSPTRRPEPSACPSRSDLRCPRPRPASRSGQVQASTDLRRLAPGSGSS